MAEQFPWTDHYKLAEDHGLLGKRLYVIFTMPTNGLGPIPEVGANDRSSDSE